MAFLDTDGLRRVVNGLSSKINQKLATAGGTITGNLAVNGILTNGGKTMAQIADERIAVQGETLHQWSTEPKLVGYINGTMPVYEKIYYGVIVGQGSGVATKTLDSGFTFPASNNTTSNYDVLLDVTGNVGGRPLFYRTGNSSGLYAIFAYLAGDGRIYLNYAIGSTLKDVYCITIKYFHVP